MGIWISYYGNVILHISNECTILSTKCHAILEPNFPLIPHLTNLLPTLIVVINIQHVYMKTYKCTQILCTLRKFYSQFGKPLLWAVFLQ